MTVDVIVDQSLINMCPFTLLKMPTWPRKWTTAVVLLTQMCQTNLWNQNNSNRMILLVFVDTVLILCAINHGIVHFKKRFQILKRLKMEIILYFTFLTIYHHIISVMSQKSTLRITVDWYYTGLSHSADSRTVHDKSGARFNTESSTLSSTLLTTLSTVWLS